MNKELILKAISAELEYNEMVDLLHRVQNSDKNIEYNHYYPNIYIDVCKRKMNNEIDDDYFVTWLIIICCLMIDNDRYYKLADYIDGCSFDEKFDKKDCQKIIAYIKDYDLKLKNHNYIKYHKKNKMKVIYLRYEFYDSTADQLLYKCYIVDYKNEIYDLRIVDESVIDYDISKNYCFIYDEEYENNIREQEKQHCEAEEELHNIFYGLYKRDKKIEL